MNFPASSPETCPARSNSDNSLITCLYGEERISEEDCDRRCGDFGKSSGAKIKGGFCSHDQCRCRYFRYGICFSKKLKSLEKREEEVMSEQLTRLAQDLDASRIMLDTVRDFQCRRFNDYHRS
ncbi:hypothetical protein QAD02_000318 [Eretmocerus hayati]|uniref:Uncharacterized protein n=1 Tax=Eretmocerus hayati TaxID=131215 RepID=A0ACC2NDC5_9HYME|nr:hypothetical protein QAD02_000318 [Eretmocerus hayati]